MILEETRDALILKPSPLAFAAGRTVAGLYPTGGAIFDHEEGGRVIIRDQLKDRRHRRVVEVKPVATPGAQLDACEQF